MGGEIIGERADVLFGRRGGEALAGEQRRLPNWP
jgi:hypothetical protein